MVDIDFQLATLPYHLEVVLRHCTRCSEYRDVHWLDGLAYFCHVLSVDVGSPLNKKVK
jgi:hypothetical protein